MYCKKVVWQFYFIFVALIAVGLISTSQVRAQDDLTFEVTNLAIRSCNTTSYIVVLDIAFNDNTTDSIYIYYGTTEPDGNTSLSVSILSNRVSPVIGWTVGYNFAPQTYPYSTSFYYYYYDVGPGVDPINNPIVVDPSRAINRFVVDLTCTGLNTGTIALRPTPGPLPTFADGRINNYDSAAPVAIFPIEFGNGNIGLHIYSADGTLLLEVTPEQLAEAPDNPETSMMIATGNGVSLYRIRGDNSGLWQINAPQYNGKTYVMIFPELFSSGGYTSYEE